MGASIRSPAPEKLPFSLVCKYSSMIRINFTTAIIAAPNAKDPVW